VNVEILSLCDAANTDSTGKLNILGVFDQVIALAEPIVHSACTIAVRMRFDKIEEGAKALKIAIVDADGREVFPTLNSNIQVRVPEGLSSGTVQILLGIQQLKLPRFGEYQIDVAIDGRVVGSIPLIAKQIPQQPSPAA
jgi:hypothetical protein